MPSYAPSKPPKPKPPRVYPLRLLDAGRRSELSRSHALLLHARNTTADPIVRDRLSTALWQLDNALKAPTLGAAGRLVRQAQRELLQAFGLAKSRGKSHSG